MHVQFAKSVVWYWCTSCSNCLPVTVWKLWSVILLRDCTCSAPQHSHDVIAISTNSALLCWAIASVEAWLASVEASGHKMTWHIICAWKRRRLRLFIAVICIECSVIMLSKLARITVEALEQAGTFQSVPQITHYWSQDYCMQWSLQLLSIIAQMHAKPEGLVQCHVHARGPLKEPQGEKIYDTCLQIQETIQINCNENWTLLCWHIPTLYHGHSVPNFSH